MPIFGFFAKKSTKETYKTCAAANEVKECTHLPPGHPKVTPHLHSGRSCPVADFDGRKHAYCAPQKGDSRSVCPALNTMANHGYLPRSGKNITVVALVRGLMGCYNLTFPFALFLAAGTFVLLRHPFRGITGIPLFAVGKHNRVEHDASIVHRDTDEEKKYAPLEIVDDWVADIAEDLRPALEQNFHKELLKKWQDLRTFSRDATTGPEPDELVKGLEGYLRDIVINAEDIARTRIRREDSTPRDTNIDGIHAEIARGEVAIILAMWERKGHDAPIKGPMIKKEGSPLNSFLTFLQYETLPLVPNANQELEVWRPTRKVGLRAVINQGQRIKKKMEEIKDEERQRAAAEPVREF